jgi:hypothetical protein
MPEPTFRWAAVQISSTILPDDDLWIFGAFALAKETTRPAIQARFQSLPGRKHLLVDRLCLQRAAVVPSARRAR